MAGKIHGGQDQRFVHGKDRASVADNAFFVPERFGKCLSERDPDVFRGVMIINKGISLAFYGKIEFPVMREQRQHVIQESDARGNIRLSGSFQRQAQFD